jgi:hypothetical protein
VRSLINVRNGIEVQPWISAQAGPYPQVDRARMSRNRSPPPRSRSRSAPIIDKPNGAEVTPSPIKPPSRGPGLRSTNQRVRFTHEDEDEQATEKEDVVSDEPVAANPPARTPSVTKILQIQQTDKGSSSKTLNASLGHTNPTTPRSVPAQRLPPEGEISSDEGETPNDHARSLRAENIRSGIKDLLDANREASVVDANTAVALEALLMQMDQRGSERSVLSLLSVRMNDSILRPLKNLSTTNLSSRVSTKAMFVERLNASAHLLTSPPSDDQSEMSPPTRTARKFHSSASEGETVWWESRCGSDLTAPPREVNYAIGDLYIHRNTAGTSMQVWICREPNAWGKVTLEYDDKFAPERVVLGLSHPSFKDRRLKLRKNGNRAGSRNKRV